MTERDTDRLTNLYGRFWRFVCFVSIVAIFVAVTVSDGVSHPEDPAASVSININTATRLELGLIPGIDSAQAAAITGYRRDVGGFRSVADLELADGISSELAEAVAPFVRLVGESIWEATR